jgi:hypothetical protein
MFRLQEIVQDFFGLKEYDDSSLIFFIFIIRIFGNDKLKNLFCELLKPLIPAAIDDLDLHLIYDFNFSIVDLSLVLNLLGLVHNEDFFLQTIYFIYVLLLIFFMFLIYFLFFGDIINRRSIGF